MTMQKFVSAWALLAVTACSNATTADGGAAAAAGDVTLGFGDTPGADGKQDAVTDAATDAAADGGVDALADALSDTLSDALQATCPGAAGCSCDGPGDCTTGLCLDTPDGKRCATPCGAGCNDGQKCVPLPDKAGKPLDVCVPSWGKLCYPCGASKDCEEPGISGSLCIDEGPLGRFCGAACKVAADCPDGYDCQVAQSPEGPKSLQCVRVAADGKSIGTCPCTPAAKASALSTQCFAEQTDLTGKVVGKCPGVRICAPTGLGPCTLVAPKAEVCDGIDNDCNGTIDEAASGCDAGSSCVGGKCTAACTPVDGGWSAWIQGACSAQCGGGTLTSTRTCDNPAPACGGKACVGDPQQSEACNTQPCNGNYLPTGTTTYGTGGQIVTGLIPPGKTTMTLLIWGGGGGGGFPGDGGGAGFGQVTVPVVAGDNIELRVAEGGDKYAGGGASYVYRNGQAIVVIGGGGGAGVDGCSGCGGGKTAGAGGGGGAIGGNGGAGTANNYVSTNSGGGQGGTQTTGGLGGKQNNISGFTGCKQDGIDGSANAGGAGIGGYQCAAPTGKCTASFEKAGLDCPGNGGSGGGGAGWFGGGSGAAMYTYTGGGGGGGSSWAASDVAVVLTEAGVATQPGGIFAQNWASQAGSGSAGIQAAFTGNPLPGRPGQITLAL